MLLERSVKAGKSRNWSAWNHLGVLRSHAGDGAGAAEAFRESLACRRTPWALRNLAVLTTAAGDAAGACDLLLEARAARPDSVPLTLETGTALIAAGRHAEWLAMLDQLPADMRGRGRVRLLEGRAALALGHLDRVQAILDDMPEIPDMREGEVSLTDLWFGLHERRLAARLGVAVDEPLRKRVRLEFPPPAAIDFRVAPDVGTE